MRMQPDDLRRRPTREHLTPTMMQRSQHDLQRVDEAPSALAVVWRLHRREQLNEIRKTFQYRRHGRCEDLARVAKQDAHKIDPLARTGALDDIERPKHRQLPVMRASRALIGSGGLARIDTHEASIPLLSRPRHAYWSRKKAPMIY